MNNIDIPKILVKHPSACGLMWRWVISVVLVEWMGISIIFQEHDRNTVELSYKKKTLTLDCHFLIRHETFNLNQSKLPELPLDIWCQPEQLKKTVKKTSLDGLPILFGNSKFEIDSSKEIKLGLDIFGSIFFMLSRYEEVVPNKFDAHSRSSGVNSFSSRAGILNRPLADEYVEVLISAVNLLWPSLEINCTPGQKIVTCDVDEPFERWIRDPIYLTKGIAGAIINRRSLSTAIRRLLNGFLSPFSFYGFDPYWNFDWYMDVCERHNRKAQFYFISKMGVRDVDAAYCVNSKRIQNLLRNIHDRGHIIGLHGSYDSFLDAEMLTTERKALQGACELAGAKQEILHSRQHYLRWHAGITPDCQSLAGLKIDSTVGYADLPGFRCGTARKFSMWGWKNMAPLELKQQPLVVMEGTLLSGVYMDRKINAENIFRDLSSKAIKFGGDYTILWHNSNLTTPRDRKMFEMAIS
jgi:hypothetical protein